MPEEEFSTSAAVTNKKVGEESNPKQEQTFKVPPEALHYAPCYS
jgi:hypothetical protein